VKRALACLLIASSIPALARAEDAPAASSQRSKKKARKKQPQPSPQGRATNVTKEVEFKGVSSGLSLPQKFPATLKVSLHGLLTFHGIQQEKTIDATLTFADTDHLRVASSFPISLDSFRVERPSLMFVRVEDKVVLDADLSMARER